MVDIPTGAEVVAEVGAGGRIAVSSSSTLEHD